MSTKSGTVSGADTKPFACTACVKRKVKCDKHQPCAACLRSRIQCLYQAPPSPQRRKRKVDESYQGLIERLRSYEATLRSAGLPFQRFDESNDGADSHNEAQRKAPEDTRGRSDVAGPVEIPGCTKQMRRRRRGHLVPEYGGKRYYEHGMIGSLGQEYRQDPVNAVYENGLKHTPPTKTSESQREASDMLMSSILTALPSVELGPPYTHPPAAEIMKYLSIFIDNVHPLTKIVHAPTLHQMMIDSNLDVPKNTDALRYSIYACAVASLTKQECQVTFGESQASLIHKFQSATKYALLQSSFLKVPDIDLLCAHLLLLTSMLNVCDPSSLWVLMGSVIRMAQSQGLHRDGAILGLSPFEIEMRRRLWWYIVMLDVRLTELTGSESSLPKSKDTLLPSNLNDSDLEPDMTTAPPERIGASEMTFCLLHYELVRFLQDHHPKSGGPKHNPSDKTGQEGDKIGVSDLEGLLEQKFLRFCDPVVAVQLLTATMARSALYKLRQMSQHKGHGHKPDEAHSTRVFEHGSKTLEIAARNLEYDNLIHSSRSLSGFLWHVHFYFPWGALVMILKMLASRSEWDDNMHAAWAQIEELYDHHTEYVEDDKVIHLIVGGLTLKAWAARQDALESRGMGKQGAPPPFISALQLRQAAFLSRHDDSRTGPSNFVNEDFNFADMVGFDALNATNFELVDATFAGTDWSNWDGYY